MQGARARHTSAALLALLFFLWGALSLAFVPWHPFWVPNLFQAVVGAGALIYFLGTRARPRPRAALAFCTGVIVYSLAILPWTAIAWSALGRPWEAFTVPHVGIVCMALVAPPEPWTGILLIAPFLIESQFAYFYARGAGLGHLVPALEPIGSVVFAILGVGILFLRRERQRLATRHTHLAAERAAYAEVGRMWSALRQELDRELDAIESDLAGERAPLRGEQLLRFERTIGRLRAIGGAFDAASVDETCANGLRGRRAGSVQDLRNRDATIGAIVFCALVAAINAMVVPISPWPEAFGALAFVGATGLAWMMVTATRPSERRALAVIVVIFAAVLPVVSLGQGVLLRTGLPFEAFLEHKLLIVIGSLAVASRLAVGVGLVVVTAADALVLFFVLHLARYRGQIALAEPWITLVFLLIGLAIQAMHEQRRVASLELLRAETDARTLQQEAVFILALRDRLNSPLQTLVLSAASLKLAPDAGASARMKGRIDRLIALSARMARAEASLRAPPTASATPNPSGLDR
jgi:hypothetical protein